MHSSEFPIEQFEYWAQNTVDSFFDKKRTLLYFYKDDHEVVIQSEPETQYIFIHRDNEYHLAFIKRGQVVVCESTTIYGEFYKGYKASDTNCPCGLFHEQILTFKEKIGNKLHFTHIDIGFSDPIEINVSIEVNDIHTKITRIQKIWRKRKRNKQKTLAIWTLKHLGLHSISFEVLNILGLM